MKLALFLTTNQRLVFNQLITLFTMRMTFARFADIYNLFTTKRLRRVITLF